MSPESAEQTNWFRLDETLETMANLPAPNDETKDFNAAWVQSAYAGVYTDPSERTRLWIASSSRSPHVAEFGRAFNGLGDDAGWRLVVMSQVRSSTLALESIHTTAILIGPLTDTGIGELQSVDYYVALVRGTTDLQLRSLNFEDLNMSRRGLEEAGERRREELDAGIYNPERSAGAPLTPGLQPEVRDRILRIMTSGEASYDLVEAFDVNAGAEAPGNKKRIPYRKAAQLGHYVILAAENKDEEDTSWMDNENNVEE